jgi:hypothetical protein
LKNALYFIEQSDIDIEIMNNCHQYQSELHDCTDNEFFVIEYHPNGNKKYECMYKKYKNGVEQQNNVLTFNMKKVFHVKHGFEFLWTENNETKYQAEYDNGKMINFVMKYYAIRSFNGPVLDKERIYLTEKELAKKDRKDYNKDAYDEKLTFHVYKWSAKDDIATQTIKLYHNHLTANLVPECAFSSQSMQFALEQEKSNYKLFKTKIATILNRFFINIK